jgi:hypothetical protein
MYMSLSVFRLLQYLQCQFAVFVISVSRAFLETCFFYLRPISTFKLYFSVQSLHWKKIVSLAQEGSFSHLLPDRNLYNVLYYVLVELLTEALCLSVWDLFFPSECNFYIWVILAFSCYVLNSAIWHLAVMCHPFSCFSLSEAIFQMPLYR